MHYVFQFAVVWDNWDRLLDGAVATLWMVGGGILAGSGRRGASARWCRRRVLRLRGALAYIEIIRNTPLLVQLFIVYFSLPSLGIRMDADEAAVLGLALNFGGYAAEILRSGIDADAARAKIEAAIGAGAAALAHLPPYRAVPGDPGQLPRPGLAIHPDPARLLRGLRDLGRGTDLGLVNSLQSTTFRSFEFYFAATLIYLVMAVRHARLLLDTGRIWAGFNRNRPALGRGPRQ